MTDAALREWCLEELARLLDRPVAEIRSDATFASLGLDSANSVGFVLSLEERLDAELDPELLGAYRTLDALLDHLASQGLA
ncbi:acyl carrier protein [Roseomonas sp. CCTCC AB2023176]|uniref:acyl carrier protein n=1 Tax=Roseomonas sp. CCTCC AB2023176 TaxID=3342640 RepID=UPI0035DCE770